MKKNELPLFQESNNQLKSMKKLLVLENFSPVIFNNFNNFLDYLSKNSCNLAILDIENNENLYTYLQNINDISSSIIPVIISPLPKSYYNDIDDYEIEFFKKPIDFKEFIMIINNRVKKENKLKKFQYNKLAPDFITNSSKMEDIYKKIQKIANTNATVLVSGETGTGKEIIANTIQRFSKRKDEKFVKINCAALPDNLLESELFGYERGAFTGATQRKIGKFEFADKGTIFLDEIAEMPLKLQAKLLRVLQEQQVERLGSNTPIKIDVRVITATNKDLKKRVEENNLREDLFYRLNVLNIHIPPLRNRKEDIKALSQYYLDLFNKKYNKNIKGFSAQVIQSFLEYRWPGNVRELQNLIESITILTDRKIISLKDLPNSFLNLASLPQKSKKNKPSFPGNNLAQNEKQTIIQTLNENNWNKTKTAEQLGISRKTLYNKMNKYDIEY
ncbi:MAG: sigma-54-dependent Fis family transcriptional regulator [Candidatus Mcinerneyibacterium aminivorans]|uniref:Sigma-54-dependent Fis family transcriptional regulator n=1 Tax=Candidatus Mcinerneyibacterium aminivorans TaxID=2703815 RepID=A0A5D0MEQ2_9BACT|nr:MAG: sigma-54-dependent Fis family transcriptional regulator [Candidatus Mcinerneyibacterium aminivorans]